MTFLAPAWLWLLLLAPLPLVWPRRLAPRAGWRVLVLALVVLGLAQPARLAATDAPAYVVLVDRSPSAGVDADELTARARALAAALGDQGDVELALFDHSLIGAALGHATAALPPGRAGAVVLATDGLSRDATWPAAAAQLAARGAALHTIELPARAVPQVTRLGVGPDFTALGPDALRVGRPLTLFAEVENRGPVRDAVLRFVPGAPDARLKTDTGFELGRTPVPADTRGAVRFDVEPGDDMRGAGALVVRLEADGTPSAELTREVLVAGPAPALYLGTRGEDARAELAGLIGAGAELITPGELGRAPAEGPVQLDRAELARFDLVVLDDQPAAGLAPETLTALAEAVREDGVGLFATGGERAFGPGGWHDTPLADLLPVELVQKEEKRDPSTTLVIIIDTSGSMGGQRVQLAKEVARLAIRRLLPHDKVGIVEFYGAKQWAAPIQPASNAIELERALNRLTAGGGTVILPAIEEAYYGLKNVRTRYKHVLILTDGGVETGAFEPLLRSMAEEGINTSTVLIGGNAHSEFLVTLSNWGKGRFYSVPNRFNLPEIILKQPTTAKLPALRPGPHELRARGGAYWFGDALAEVADGELPALDAYVETRLRPGAAALLESREEAHPVLATWALGQGRVTALTTELTGPASAGWREAEFLAPLLGRTLERTLRAEAPRELSADTDGALLTVTETYSAAARPAGAPASRTALAVHAPSETATFVALGADQAGALAPAAWQPELGVGAPLDFAALAHTSGTRLTYDQWTADWRPTPGAPPANGPALRLQRLWPLCFVLAALAYLAEVLWRRSRPTARP